MARLLRCSFCGKSEREVSSMIAGARAHICDGCVESSAAILAATHAEPLNNDAALASLVACDAAVDAAREVLQRRVELLRSQQVSWESIGKALGVSRQSAWERFH